MISTDEEAGCGLAGYLQRYEQQSTHLLNYRGSLGGDHPHGHSYFQAFDGASGARATSHNGYLADVCFPAY